LPGFGICVYYHQFTSIVLAFISFAYVSR
jgi:hypothetical protein